MMELRATAGYYFAVAFLLISPYTFSQTPSTAAPPGSASRPEAQFDQPDSAAKLGAALSEKLNDLAAKIQAVELRSASSDAVFGLMGALFGAIIGAGASLLVLWRTNRFARKRDEQSERQRQQAVRTLIKAEIDENLRMLREEAERIDFTQRPDDMSGIEWVAMHPCPKWCFTAWIQTTAQFHGALSDEQIRNVQTFYGNLQSYTAAREALSALYQHTQLYKYVSVPFHKADTLLEALLATKNPLG